MKSKHEIFSDLDFFCHHCKGYIGKLTDIDPKKIDCPHCGEVIYFSSKFQKYYRFIFKNLDKVNTSPV